MATGQEKPPATTSLKEKLLSRTSRKYYASEILASLLALVASAGSAYLMDLITDSDALISVVSALGGTTGFVVGTAGIYAVLHLRQYLRGERTFRADVKNILRANLHGILAMYVVRIPLQFCLQKWWLSPPVAATVAQAASGFIATAVRAHHNYKADIFGAAAEQP